MTPAPLLLFVWGIAMALQLLPRIWGFALPKTPAWYRAGRVLGVAAICSSGPWLLLDLTLPHMMQRQAAGRLADSIGWGFGTGRGVMCRHCDSLGTIIVGREPTEDGARCLIRL